MTFTGQWKIITYGQTVSSRDEGLLNKRCGDPYGLLPVKI